MPDRVNLEGELSVDGESPREPSRWAWRGWPWPPWRPRCQGCGERGAPDRDLCPACDAALPRIRAACVTCGLPLHGRPAAFRCDACRRATPPLTRVVAPFRYEPPLDRWLPRFKFHHDLAVGRLLSQLMLDACAAAPRPEALVPVPLHRARLRSRGYDQALELARPIARELALPLRTDLLARRRATSAQSSLHAAERQNNPCGAFLALPFGPDDRPPAHIALVDDVMTTGSTLHAAARALLDGGIARVDAWVCARTL